jgi:hypothetical protein
MVWPERLSEPDGKASFVTGKNPVTKGGGMGRPTKRKDGVPMIGAERQARYRKRLRKSINRKARTKYREDKQGDATQLHRAASRAALPIADGFDYRIGDARVVLADIPDNSVPLILTDPPYGHEAEPLYRWLAEFAARVLIPGGSLICYTGQGKLDRDMAILGARLKYWWLCMMPHIERQKLFGSGVLATFKPVLWFVKDHRRKLPSGTRPLMSDEFKSPKRDKLAHAWAQGEGGVWIPIEHLTEPGELIIDPFAGTGTFGRIAHAMGRRWIGADIMAGGSTTVAA